MPSIPSHRALLSLALAASACVLASAQTVSVDVPVPSPVAGATVVSRVSSATVLNGSISLAPANPTGFQTYADGVSDPKSPNYHRFLTPAQIGERFGASAATVNTVTSYLQGKGLTVTLVADNHMAILFKGTAAKAEAAFGTTLYNYKSPNRKIGPKAFYSNSTVPKLPVAFASKVVSIGGLQNSDARTPLTTYLTPQQDRGLYKVDGLYAQGYQGQGMVCGVSNLGDGYRISNLNTFYSTYGLPTPSGGVGSNVTKVAIGGVDGETQADGLESNLDIQMILANAPLAKVVVYDGWADYVSIVTRETNDNLVDVISESWVLGADVNTLVAAHNQHLAMTIQGITFLAGTGDWGTDESRGNYPHADPDVLAIGGTDATVSDANGTRVSEPAWNAGGGGWEPSAWPFNGLPSYQKNASGIPQNIPHRLFPDVSLHATGSWIVSGGAVTAVGGTSSSGPQFVGQLALILQALKAQGAADGYTDGKGATHYRLGRIADFIYAQKGDASTVVDVVDGDIGVLPDGSQATAKVAWDYATGWGAPVGQGLYDALFAASSYAVVDPATSSSIYVATSPTLTLGTLMSSDTNGMVSAGDGTSYTLQTVAQPGVGQVAATKVNFTLSHTDLRSATLTVAMASPALTTGFVYLYNTTTGVYDAVATMPGAGATKSLTLSLDLAKYLSGSSVKAILRVERPTRLGTAPFQVSVDQAIVTARVPRGSTGG